jgi:hypothetical protein
MAILSSKRQITLPKELCDQADIHPGDLFRPVSYNGQITLIKQRQDASVGVLRHLRACAEAAERDSRDQALVLEDYPPLVT